MSANDLSARRACEKSFQSSSLSSFLNIHALIIIAITINAVSPLPLLQGLQAADSFE